MVSEIHYSGLTVNGLGNALLWTYSEWSRKCTTLDLQRMVSEMHYSGLTVNGLGNALLWTSVNGLGNTLL